MGQCALFWKDQKEATRAVLDQLGTDYLDEATVRQYRMIDDFVRHVLPILHLLTDRMIPRELERMAADGFCEALQFTGLTEAR
jgi:hypothetical protein